MTLSQTIMTHLETFFSSDPEGVHSKGFEITDDRLYIWTSEIENRSGSYHPRMETLFELLTNEGWNYEEDFQGYISLDLFRD